MIKGDHFSTEYGQMIFDNEACLRILGENPAQGMQMLDANMSINDNIATAMQIAMRMLSIEAYTSGIHVNHFSGHVDGVEISWERLFDMMFKDAESLELFDDPEPFENLAKVLRQAADKADEIAKSIDEQWAD
jgi:hypothetical protein